VALLWNGFAEEERSMGSFMSKVCLRSYTKCSEVSKQIRNGLVNHQLCYRSKRLITVIPRLTKIIRSGITFVSRNVISRRFL